MSALLDVNRMSEMKFMLPQHLMIYFCELISRYSHKLSRNFIFAFAKIAFNYTFDLQIKCITLAVSTPEY